ncbi:MAG: phenylalanine--tRNA ligase subunit alpha [Chloroflexi bacterium RBG_16_50_9]|nr:MAG: phenylalanine--tRNA ligase subunit alpha [Chloroflexi bacterium RBG_16_50_9]
MEQIEGLKEKALRELEGIASVKDLESWRVHYLGKRSELNQILRSLATLPIEERKATGASANQTKTLLEAKAEHKWQALREAQLTASAREEFLDISLPGRPYPIGHLHPITQTINEMCDIFISMGFQIVEGPDVEWDYYNFEALNIPAEHPARDTMSSSWVAAQDSDGKTQQLLRTHTTAVTARTLESMKPPIRAVEPGRVYRYEASDATHVPMFHQIDGVVVDRGITMADLKGTLYEVARRYFGEDRKVRFRCDFFPFVEPGVEMAIECLACRGGGCRLCGNSGWIEILGAGMTHPQVLEYGGINPKDYTSFAFGIGIDRLPMLRYGIDDVRLFYGNDLRFLSQF